MIHRNLRALFERLLILPALVLCIGSPGAFAAAVGGGTYYVSGAGDDATGNGSEANPWRTITHAVSQAGGQAPTIMVGAGTYTVDAGEDYPIRIDEDDAMGIRITGPGDGSATIIQGYSEDTLLGAPDLFEADDYVSGAILISGLDIEGTSDCMLDLDYGAGEVLIHDINAIGIGLLDVDSNLEGGSYVLSNNHVMGVSGNALSMSFYFSTYNSSAADISNTTNLSLNNNTFSDCGAGLYYYLSQWSGGTLDFNLSVIGNEFIDCSTAIEMSESIWTEVNYNAVEVIEGNIFQNVDYGIQAYFHCSYTCLINRDIQITDNEMLMTSSQEGVYMSTGVDEYMEYQEDVLIAGNEISGAYYGVWAEFLNDYESSNMERNWRVLNNDIRNVYSEALYLENDCTAGLAEHDYELLVDGNTLQGNGAGLYVGHSMYSSSNESSIKHVITRNHISDNSDYAVLITASNSSAEVDHDVVLRGNVFQGNQGTSNSAVVEVNISNSEGFYGFSFDMGNVGAYGYNTIVADEANPLSGSISCDVYTSSVVAGQVNMVGNWWGTQDLMEIADRVWDQADSSDLFAADISNPLPDSLDFTAEYVDGVGIVVTAGADAGFVAYAGDLIMMGSITGPEPGGGEIEASWVSEDYQTLTLPDPAGEAPAGDYEICLTNPGGQTGCASFTVEDDGTGEDCSQNQIPTAVSEDADTDPQTAVTVDVTANDWDPNGNLDPTTVEILDTPDKGTASVNADGSITYIPNNDLLDDSDAMTYVVYDTCGSPSNAATLHVRIGGHVNLIPTAGYDEVITEQDAAITINVLDNDYDPDGSLDTGSVQIIDTPGKGTAVVNPDGSVTYTPNPGVVATTDTFTYTVNDDVGDTSNAATVGVQIRFITDGAKVTGGFGEAGRDGTPGTRGGLGNTGTLHHGTRGGTSAMTGGDCDGNQAPVAVHDNASTPIATAVVIDLTGNDSDYNGNMDPTAVVITQGPDKGTLVNNGDGTVSYTPNAEETYTTDTFNYTVGDTCGATSNIAPCQVFIGEGGGENDGDDCSQNQAPVAVHDNASTPIATAVVIDLTGNDSDYNGNMDSTAVVITLGPDKGTLVNNGDGTVSYTPNAEETYTTDTFNYTVGDTCGATSNIAPCQIFIGEGGGENDGDDCSQNQAPVAVHDNASTPIATAVLIDLTGNDSDYNGNMDSTAVVITLGPDKGTLVNNGDGTVSYTPNAEETYTTDTFNYTVADTCGATSNIAPCQIFIGEGGGENDGDDCSQNQAPVAVHDNASTPIATAVVIDLTGNDSDYNDNMDPTAVVITLGPDKGTLVNNGDGTVSYTPNAEETYTTDTFNYTVGDTCGATSNIAPCQIFIGEGGGENDGDDCSQNQAPVAVHDNASTPQATAVVIDLTGNDSDYNDNMDSSSVVITQGPDKGTLVNNGDGTVSYTPNAEETYTTDTFNYTVGDTCGATSNIAPCQIFVGEGGGGDGGDDGNHMPTANFDGADTEADTAVNIAILANDTDPDDDALDDASIVITQAPAKGAVVVNADGTVTYTPNDGVAGTMDTFNYTVDDEHGATSNIATVSVAIGFETDSDEVSGGAGGNSGRTGTPGSRGGGLGNTGTVNQGTRTP